MTFTTHKEIPEKIQPHVRPVMYFCESPVIFKMFTNITYDVVGNETLVKSFLKKRKINMD